MTTKKLLLIVGGVIGVILLLVAIFVGGILGIVFYSIGNSEAATVAKDFLKSNEELKQDIGEVQDFGSFITGNINVAGSNGDATLHLKVKGARKTVNASVSLASRNGRPWRVTDATYINEAGQTVELLNKYEETGTP